MQPVSLEGCTLKIFNLAKADWLDRAVQIYNYHIGLCKSEKAWTIEKTAISLNRSVGSISQNLTIASWTRTHEKQLRRFHSMRDALEYIKEKKAEMKHQEIDLD